MSKALNYNEIKKALARQSFFDYCNIKAPDFYKWNRDFLVEFCSDLQEFFESDKYKVLIVNLPPRHGKSRTVGCFVEWVLGIDQSQKIMTGSYNETLSTTFSKGVRNTIQEIKADSNKLVYSEASFGSFGSKLYIDDIIQNDKLDGGYGMLFMYIWHSYTNNDFILEFDGSLGTMIKIKFRQKEYFL